MSIGSELTTKPDANEFPVYTGDSLARNKLAFLTDGAAFGHLWRVATGYSRSMLVPEAFRGKKDDCFIACQLAMRLNVDPFMLMQSMYIVHGRPGFEAKLAIALLNSSGKIKGTVKTQFSGTGDDYGCRAWCIDADTGERVDGPKVDWKMVKGEGWSKDKTLRNGGGVQRSKWNTMPDLMFVYRASAFLIRSNYPEVLMGMSTAEELEDAAADRRSIDMSNQSRLELLLAGTPDATDPPIETTAEPVAEGPQEEPVPESDIDARNREGQEAYSRFQANKEPIDSEPEAEPSDDEFVTVAQWKDDLASVTSLAELAESKTKIPKTLSLDGQKAILDAIEMREAAVRGSRGQRSNQKSLVE